MRYFFLLVTLISLSGYAQESFLEQAQRQEKAGDYEGAYTSYKAAGEAHYQSDQISEYANAHIKMVDMQLQEGNYFQAKSLAENTLQFIIEELPSERELTARCKTLLGLSYLNLGRNDDALEELLEAEPLFGTDSEAKADCFDALGLVYTNNENVQLATQYLELGLRLRRKLFGSQSLPVGNSFNNLGRVFLSNDPLQAIIYFNRARNIYEKLLSGDSRRTLRAKLNIAYANMEQENYEKALDLLE